VTAIAMAGLFFLAAFFSFCRWCNGAGGTGNLGLGGPLQGLTDINRYLVYSDQTASEFEFFLFVNDFFAQFDDAGGFPFVLFIIKVFVTVAVFDDFANGLVIEYLNGFGDGLWWIGCPHGFGWWL
jgi:hypothetical protein